MEGKALYTTHMDVNQFSGRVSCGPQGVQQSDDLIDSRVNERASLIPPAAASRPGLLPLTPGISDQCRNAARGISVHPRVEMDLWHGEAAGRV